MQHSLLPLIYTFPTTFHLFEKLPRDTNPRSNTRPTPFTNSSHPHSHHLFFSFIYLSSFVHFLFYALIRIDLCYYLTVMCIRMVSSTFRQIVAIFVCECVCMCCFTFIRYHSIRILRSIFSSFFLFVAFASFIILCSSFRIETECLMYLWNITAQCLSFFFTLFRSFALSTARVLYYLGNIIQKTDLYTESNKNKQWVEMKSVTSTYSIYSNKSLCFSVADSILFRSFIRLPSIPSFFRLYLITSSFPTCILSIRYLCTPIALLTYPAKIAFEQTYVTELQQNT